MYCMDEEANSPINVSFGSSLPTLLRSGAAAESHMAIFILSNSVPSVVPAGAASVRPYRERPDPFLKAPILYVA